MNQRDSKVLVTGATGFLGRNLLTALIRQGTVSEIRALCRDYPAVSLPSEVNIRICDLSDVEALESHIIGCDVIYHLMSGTVPSTSNENPNLDVDVNLQGSLRLLQASANSGVRRIVFVSSGGTVYGRLIRQPVPEDHPTNPICSHGIIKLAIEKYLHLFKEIRGLDYTILRVSNPYGPHQNTTGIQGVVAAFVSRMLLGEPIEIWGDGSVVRDFIYVDDVTRALLAARTMPRHTSAIYNVGSGVGTSIRELIAALEETGISSQVTYRDSRSFDVPASVLDIAQITRNLGWKPNYSLAEGLKETVAWFDQRQEDLSTGTAEGRHDSI